MDIYTKDAKLIKKTYKLLQLLNIIISSLLIIASFVVMIVVACEDDTLWLIPFGTFWISIITFVIIYNSLHIKFGMYYDIRMTRLATQYKNDSINLDEFTLPEL